jgi:glycosyltransferase 2 family protein
MLTPGVKKFGKRVLQIGLPVVVLALFLYQVKKNWAELTAQTFQLNLWLLALAFLGFMFQELSYGLIWRAVLERLGSHLGLRTSLRIYLASEFVRYIPGNVWHVLTRILWVSKYGVSRPVAFTSMAIELITKLAAGLLVFSVSLLFWRDYGAIGSLLHGSLVEILGVVSILALLIGLHPRVLHGVLNWLLRRFKREPVQLTLRYRDILFITLAWCASWFVAGCAFYVLLLALWPEAPLVALPICIGIYAFAWDIGFVSFITPSGLGVREAAIVGIFALALPLPAGLATVMALLSRFVTTIAEVVCVGIAYLSGGKQVLSIQQDTQSRSLLQEETNGNSSELKNLTGEISESVPVEGGVMGE